MEISRYSDDKYWIKLNGKFEHCCILNWLSVLANIFMDIFGIKKMVTISIYLLTLSIEDANTFWPK